LQNLAFSGRLKVKPKQKGVKPMIKMKYEAKLELHQMVRHLKIALEYYDKFRDKEKMLNNIYVPHSNWRKIQEVIRDIEEVS